MTPEPTYIGTYLGTYFTYLRYLGYAHDQCYDTDYGSVWLAWTAPLLRLIATHCVA